MGNLEKPLTWGLVIVLLGYLFVANCECNEENSCTLNNGFNIGFEDEVVEVETEVKVEIQGLDESIDVASIVDIVLEEVKKDPNIDTIIINNNTTEEETTVE